MILSMSVKAHDASLHVKKTEKADCSKMEDVEDKDIKKIEHDNH